ncbi:MAG: hypothetical protein JRI23_09330 [Deltaproteobacteria bacterium]|nr:hypothetical protein [Deltaproteobacteria bacterium]MBW2531844.1 hypothetical protein [Deltaproteobacteria bacterium]
MTSRPPARRAHDLTAVERRREAASGLVLACYRLAKACQLYDDANQTVKQLLSPVVQAVAEFCSLFDIDTIKVLFTRDMVFVNRKIMQAPRETYAVALQLGALLEKCGVTELTFEQSVDPQGIGQLGRAIADGQRNPAAADPLRDGEVRGVTARNVPGPDVEDELDPSETAVARVIKAYAASSLIIKSFYRRLSEGRAPEAHEVKRVAQKLTTLGEEYPELLMAAAAAPFPDGDPPRRAVSTAVIAQAMLRQITTDRLALTSLALAALLADVGQTRIGVVDDPVRLGPSALVTLTNIGQLHAAAVRRTVVVYEALRMPSVAESPYGEEPPPALLSSILFFARSLNELRTPDGQSRPPSIGQALETLEAEATDEASQAFYQMLVRGLGFLPNGTFVELDSGEVAQVTGSPALPLDFARPKVRILTDPKKKTLPTPLDVDLARPAADEPARVVCRALSIGGSSPFG